jgi:hypothetical protein
MTTLETGFFVYLLRRSPMLQNKSERNASSRKESFEVDSKIVCYGIARFANFHPQNASNRPKANQHKLSKKKNEKKD